VLDYLFGLSFFCNRDNLDTHRHRGLAVLAPDTFREIDLFDGVAIFDGYFPYKLTHRSSPEQQFSYFRREHLHLAQESADDLSSLRALVGDFRLGADKP
jgi:hypothetical protein